MRPPDYLSAERRASIVDLREGKDSGWLRPSVIDYEISDDKSSGHTQVFCGNRLVRWEIFPLGVAALRVIRTREVDRVDFTSAMGADWVTARTRIGIGDSVLDILGTQLLHQRDVAVDDVGFDVVVLIVAKDGPFGDVSAALHWQNGHWSTLFGAEAQAKVRSRPAGSGFEVRADYGAIMRWLHGDALLGHLIYEGARVRGNLFMLSAVDGIVSAPPTRDAVDFCATGWHVLAEYASARQSLNRRLGRVS